MKKSILLILITSLPYLLVSQIDLGGRYCMTTNAGFDTACYNFKVDGSFEYYETGCLGQYTFVAGTYEIFDSKIRLIANESDERYRTIVEELPDEKDGTVRINFRVSDMLNQGIQSTIFPDSLPLHDFSFEKHLTDPDGYVEWREKKENKKVLISLEPTAGSIFKFELDFNKSQIVLVKILAPGPNFMKSRELAFELISDIPNMISINGNPYIKEQ